MFSLTDIFSLSPTDNNIGSEGAKALAEAIKTNQTVHTIGLNGAARHHSLFKVFF